MEKDKKIELLRYDKRARGILKKGESSVEITLEAGSQLMLPIYRTPYQYYEKRILKYVTRHHDVLELCSGTGLHTYILKQTGARVTAIDISLHSLEVLRKRVRDLRIQVADIEALPFKTNSFDVVTIAGSLSYGSPTLVDAEIRRVLRPGGIFLCVDSLNHNPIYRLNRWINYLKGYRTKNTMLSMPTLERIHSISRGFKSTEVKFFGCVTYLMPAFARVIGQEMAAKVSDEVDRMLKVHKSAFKFVFVGYERLK